MIGWSACPGAESIPGKHSGDWLYTGSRLPVYSLFESLESGAALEEFMEWFHPMDEWKVNAVLQHAADSLKTSAEADSVENPV